MVFLKRTKASMSAIKSPQEKKRLSLKLDRRNVYGENDKASRKLIPKGKQRNHMGERRSANAALLRARGAPDEDRAVASEVKAREATIHAKRTGFKKRPDLPLGTVLERKAITGTRWMSVLQEWEPH
jgi:hypothetical protein